VAFLSHLESALEGDKRIISEDQTRGKPPVEMFVVIVIVRNEISLFVELSLISLRPYCVSEDKLTHSQV
jgi:hypothetical protein